MEIIYSNNNNYYVYNFYTKGLDPYLQQKIWSLIEHLNYYDWLYNAFKEDNFSKIIKEHIFENEKNALKALYKLKEECNIVNNIMIENQRNPLFIDLNDIDYLIKRRDELLFFGSEEECSKIVGCKNFSEYNPKIND